MDAACCEGGKTRREANGRRGRSCAATNERTNEWFPISRRQFTVGFSLNTAFHPEGYALSVSVCAFHSSLASATVSQTTVRYLFSPRIYVYIRTSSVFLSKIERQLNSAGVLGNMKLLTSDITFELIFLLFLFLLRVFQLAKYQLK